MTELAPSGAPAITMGMLHALRVLDQKVPNFNDAIRQINKELGEEDDGHWLPLVTARTMQALLERYKDELSLYVKERVK